MIMMDRMGIKERRGSVLRNCEQCGCEFSVWISALSAGKGRFCSATCSGKFRTGKPSPKSKTRSDKKPDKPHVCQWCGKVFVSRSHAGKDKPRQYCSNKCLGLSKRKNSKEHPRRKDGAALQLWARRVILRDKECVRCGTREALQAHHVKSYSKHADLRLDVNNGVALCPVCHHAQHPNHSLEFYLQRGGQTVQRCAVCESSYLPRKPKQRTCSPKCGRKLRYSCSHHHN